MNKGQLIDSVAADLETSKAAAARAVEAVLTGMVNGIKHDDNLTISGFGSFFKKARAARTVRNPMTGVPIEVKATTTVSFRPSQALKSDLSSLELAHT
jgi:DNA-binding protein HU-beta